MPQWPWFFAGVTKSPSLRQSKASGSCFEWLPKVGAPPTPDLLRSFLALRPFIFSHESSLNMREHH